MDSKLKEAVDKANTLSDSTGDIFFIYDKNEAYGDDTDDDYYITDDILNQYPSRRSIYDTQFRELESSKKFQKVYKILEKLKFESSINNMGERYEQSFIKHCDPKVGDNITSIMSLILKPNMTITLKSLNNNGESLVLYQGFFNISKIFNILSYHDSDVKPILRDIVIDSIFE